MWGEELQSHIKLNITTQNRIKILQILQEEGAQSRIDLAKKMNITKAAVTLITSDMILDGILYEKGIQNKQNLVSRGRRKILLDINENYKLVVGIVIENEYLYIGLTNLKGEALDKKQIILNEKSYIEILESIVYEINSLLKNNCLLLDKILALGVCISSNSGNFIEGNLIFDKLQKLKKDLAHAINLPICAQTTINASLIAEHLFANEKPQNSNILIIRYGKKIESAILINKKIYMPNKYYIGGFAQLQQKNNTNSYNEYLAELSCSSNPLECKERLNEKLAYDINICNTILQTDKIFAFGDYFEEDDNLNTINSILKKEYKFKNLPLRGVIKNQNIYLCACAIAINDFLFNTGGTL